MITDTLNDGCTCFFFAENKAFMIVIERVLSEDSVLISGVPQGTVLASLLFIMFNRGIDVKLKFSTAL